MGSHHVVMLRGLPFVDLPVRWGISWTAALGGDVAEGLMVLGSTPEWNSVSA